MRMILLRQTPKPTKLSISKTKVIPKCENMLPVILSHLQQMTMLSLLLFTTSTSPIRLVQSFRSPRRKVAAFLPPSTCVYHHNQQTRQQQYSWSCIVDWRSSIYHPNVHFAATTWRRTALFCSHRQQIHSYQSKPTHFGSILRNVRFNACPSAINARRSSTTSTLTTITSPGPSSNTQLHVHQSVRDADIVEMLIGGERYSLVPMPERMKSTTIYVGNICEFVQDRDLSSYFSQVSTLTTVPSCVVRKVDTQSMGYGFVSFPNVQEKEAAIMKFHNSEWRGKRIKVEPIHDEVVRIPEYMVEYVYGPVSKTQKPRFNNNNNNNNSEKEKSGNDKDLIPVQRISKDDVERLSRGQPAKRRGYGSRNVPHRLNDEERQEYDRATLRKGYLTLSGNGNRRTRKGSPLKNIHRQWCDARDCPQILLYKAVSGGNMGVQDEVVIDLSPLRLHGLFDRHELVDDFLVRWKAQIFTAAYESGMEFLDTNNDTNSNDDDDDECNVPVSIPRFNDSGDEDDRDCIEEMNISSLSSSSQSTSAYTVTLSQTATIDQTLWATNPIWQLPVVSLGSFVGERSKAKLMASNLAKLWNIPECLVSEESRSMDLKTDKVSSTTSGNGPPKSRRDAGAKKGGYTKTKGIQEHRKRGGGHRQAW